MQYYVTTPAQMDILIADLRAMDIGPFGIHFETKTGQRTLLQNSALHKYFQLLSDELNSAGLDMRRTLKPDLDIPWTPDSVKEHLWKPIQKAVMGQLSTTKLNRSQVSQVYEVLQRHMGEKHGIYVPFPQNQYPA